MTLRRFLVVLGALTIALGFGAAERGAADTTSGCAGKPLCATVTDLEWASISPSETDRRYMTNESVTVSNGGTTSKLVNVTVTIVWWDEGVTTTTSSLVAASSFTDAGSLSCTESTPVDDTSEFPAHRKTMTCGTFKSLAPQETLTYAPLVLGTATNAAATGTTVAVKATTKEQDKPSKGGAPPNDAVVRVSNTTPYEPRDDEDLSIAGSGLSTTLATSKTVGRQFSQLPVPAGGPRDLYQLLEQDFGETCPEGITCFGQQQVTTIASGLAPVNLWITYTGPIPGGLTENNLVVVHDREGGTAPDPVSITTPCGTTLFSGAVPATIPCRTVKITHGFAPGGIARVEVDVWDIENGDWRYG